MESWKDFLADQRQLRSRQNLRPMVKDVMSGHEERRKVEQEFQVAKGVFI